MTRRRALCVANPNPSPNQVTRRRALCVAKDYVAADAIKKELKALNVTVVDTDDPPTWYVGKRKSKAAPKPAGLCFAFQKVRVLD